MELHWGLKKTYYQFVQLMLKSWEQQQLYDAATMATINSMKPKTARQIDMSITGELSSAPFLWKDENLFDIV
jgi:hypothetical protein